MANMSYCRFENTLADLRDCERSMIIDLSEQEEDARRKLIRLCIKIAKEYGPAKVSNALYAIPLEELNL